MKNFNIIQMFYYDKVTNNETHKGDLFLSSQVKFDIDDDLLCIRTEDYINIGNKIKFTNDENISPCLKRYCLKDVVNNNKIKFENIKYVTACFNYFIILDIKDNLIFTEDIKIVTI